MSSGNIQIKLIYHSGEYYRSIGLSCFVGSSKWFCQVLLCKARITCSTANTRRRKCNVDQPVWRLTMLIFFTLLMSGSFWINQNSCFLSFRCTQCDKSVVSKQELKEHTLIHHTTHDERPHHCAECNMSFVLKVRYTLIHHTSHIDPSHITHWSITHYTLIHHTSHTDPSHITHWSITHHTLIHHTSHTDPAHITHWSITHHTLVHHTTCTDPSHTTHWSTTHHIMRGPTTVLSVTCHCTQGEKQLPHPSSLLPRFPASDRPIIIQWQ